MPPGGAGLSSSSGACDPTTRRQERETCSQMRKFSLLCPVLSLAVPKSPERRFDVSNLLQFSRKKHCGWRHLPKSRILPHRVDQDPLDYFGCFASSRMCSSQLLGKLHAILRASEHPQPREPRLKLQKKHTPLLHLQI